MAAANGTSDAARYVISILASMRNSWQGAMGETDFFEMW